MQEILVSKEESGQRLDKYLRRRLPLAPSSFIYKMLRKKNITLRGKKADGSEKVEAGDSVKLFLSDETILKFSRPQDDEKERREAREDLAAYQTLQPLLGPSPVLYEDDNILVVRKPSGVLSQKAGRGDVSMNEWLRGYLAQKKEAQKREAQKTEAQRRDGQKTEGQKRDGQNTEAQRRDGQKKEGHIRDGQKTEGHIREEGVESPEPSAIFRPSVCNRLDRNTGGILLCAKTLPGSRALSAVIRDRVIRKTYIMVVHGQILEEGVIDNELIKNREQNRVRVAPIVHEQPYSAAKESGTGSFAAQDEKSPGSTANEVRRRAVTVYRPVKTGENATMVEADLITGRSHQLRVHMASIGHPIVSDPAYGDRQLDSVLLKGAKGAKGRRPGQSGQLLWCSEVAFPSSFPETAEDAELKEILSPAAGRIFRCPPPRWWSDLCKV